MAGRLTGKVAIITGGSRGRGRYCADAYAAEGATVVATARSHDPSQPPQIASASGGSVVDATSDVADPASLRSMVEGVLERFGHVDLLMTNAVYYAPGTLSTIEAPDWDLQFKVNVHGVFHAIRAVLPSMIENGGGGIITISSIAAERGSHYGATKRAVAGITLGFAEEQKPNGVAVNSLRPVAAIRTPGWEQSRPADVLQARSHRVSPPDSYVEAAILLAMRTAEDCSGETFTDTDVIRRFGAPGNLERFRAMNAAVWSENLRPSPDA